MRWQLTGALRRSILLVAGPGDQRVSKRRAEHLRLAAVQRMAGLERIACIRDRRRRCWPRTDRSRSGSR
jgi:hypothetical protein